MRLPCAAATSTCWTTEARYAAVEKGRTMPVVPSSEMPPTMPRRALVVSAAISSPRGTEKVTTSGGRGDLGQCGEDDAPRDRVDRGCADR